MHLERRKIASTHLFSTATGEAKLLGGVTYANEVIVNLIQALDGSHRIDFARDLAALQDLFELAG